MKKRPSHLRFRHLIKVLVGWFLINSCPDALAQGPGPVLTWKAQTTFNAYLVRNLHQLYDQRARRLQAALASPDSLNAYQQQVRQTYLNVLGQFPEKQAINAKVTKRIPQNGFRIESLVYESRPNHHVTATLYLPAGKGPFPAVLLMNGHEMMAKATESYQKTARLFALHGFVVLSIDPFSQGERVQLTDAAGASLTRGATTEHTLLNAGANLVGTSVAAYMLWDNVRGLDYLETRPEVAKDRIGAVGNSGGGTQTAYLMAYDPRIKVAAPVSYFTQRARYMEVAGAQDGCQYLPGEGSLEMADFIIAAAPKPVLVLAGENDFVDHRGTLLGFEELKKVYTALRQPDKVKLFVWPDGHGISQPKREAAVTWFRKWLYQDDREIKEGEIGVLSEKELQVTTTGQVATAFPKEATIQMLNHGQFLKYAPQRQKFVTEKDLNILRDKVKKVLGLNLNQAPVFSEKTGEIKTEKYHLEKRIVLREGELPIPVLIYTPVINSQMSGKVMVRLESRGFASLLKDDSVVLQQMKAGNTLVLADVRGIGESQDDPKLNDAKYWSNEYRNAVLSLHLQRPLLTQRVQDVLSILDYLQSRPGWDKLAVLLQANGVYGPVVAHAAFLDDRIQTASIRNSPVSLESYLTQPLQREMYSTVVQGMLLHYDLPDLVRRSNARINYLPQ